MILQTSLLALIVNNKHKKLKIMLRSFLISSDVRLKARAIGGEIDGTTVLVS